MSIADIASLTNVSIATVSRYINGSGKVADQTAKRIEEAMQQTGYRPSVRRPGRKPENRQGIRTGVITFLSIGRFNAHHMHQEPVFPMLLAGIQGYLIEQGMMVIYAHSQGGDDIPEALDSKFCDGVIVYGIDCTLGKRLKAKLKKMPAVWCFNRVNEKAARGFAQVSYDNRLVGKMAAEHFHTQGHKQVAFFGQSIEDEIFLQRKQDFIERCTELGMQAHVFESHHSASVSAYASQRIEDFQANAPQCTGLFFTSDNFMLSVYNEMRVMGLDVGKIEILGCNNEQQFLAHFLNPPATIDIQVQHVGSRAAEYVLGMINNPASGENRRINLKPQLIHAAELAGV